MPLKNENRPDPNSYRGQDGFQMGLLLVYLHLVFNVRARCKKLLNRSMN